MPVNMRNHFWTSTKDMRHILTSLLLIIPMIASAQMEGWVNREGSSIPNTDAMKTINGFGGWLVITSDPDWEEKWNTSPETIPYFSGTNNVSYGGQLTILTFYINAKTDASEKVDVLCNIKVIKPDGSNSINAEDIQCAEGKLKGDAGYIRLTSAVIKFIGEEGDPSGEWIVEVLLTDKVRGTSVPLKTHFHLKK